MAEDKVSAKIITDAKKKAKEIEAEYAQRIETLNRQQKETITAYKEETKKLAKLEKERIHREIISEARLASNKEVLTTKHELINTVLKKAAQDFTRARSYSTLIAKIVKQHGKGSIILLSESDKKKFKSSAWAKKSETAPIMGGIILRTPKYDLNFSIDAAFETLGEQLTLEISEILFSTAGKK